MSDCRRIPPGHRCKGSNGSFSLERTWSAVQAHSNNDAGAETRASELRDLLAKRVRELGAGKQVGVLLSGGYDSTLITLLLARAGIVPRCYTVEASGPGPNEWQYASAIADLVKAPIQRITVTLDDLLRTSKDMYRIRPLPQVCWITGSQFAAAQAAKEDGCDILMLGIGSDEVFGPYPREARAAWKFEVLAQSIGAEAAWEQLLGESSKVRTDTLFLGNISPFQKEHLTKLFPDSNIPSLLETDIIELFRELHCLAPESEISKFYLQLELELRSSDILMDEINAASTLAGIEVIYPFYDQAVVEFAASVPLSLTCIRTEYPKEFDPDTFQWKNVIDKHILKLAFQDIMPDVIARRPRLPYTVPISSWVQGRSRDILRSAILESSLWEQIDVRKDGIAQIIAEPLDEGNPWRAPLRFWLLYQLASWWEDCLRHRPADTSILNHSQGFQRPGIT